MCPMDGLCCSSRFRAEVNHSIRRVLFRFCLGWGESIQYMIYVYMFMAICTEVTESKLTMCVCRAVSRERLIRREGASLRSVIGVRRMSPCQNRKKLDHLECHRRKVACRM